MMTHHDRQSWVAQAVIGTILPVRDHCMIWHNPRVITIGLPLIVSLLVL